LSAPPYPLAVLGSWGPHRKGGEVRDGMGREGKGKEGREESSYVI